MFIDFGESGKGGGEREICERETPINWLPLIPSPTGNETCNLDWCWPGIKPVALWYMRRCSNQLSHLARARRKIF